MTFLNAPNERIAEATASEMLAESPVAAARIPFGNQNYVYEILALSGRYVLRLTTPEWAESYASAIGLQQMLLRLQMPLAPFLQHDLVGQHSPYPALLISKVEGTDLFNIYPSLTEAQKIALADQVAAIHARTAVLPAGRGYGQARFGQDAPCSCWSAFMRGRWTSCAAKVIETRGLSEQALKTGWKLVERALEIADPVPATPFLWDMGDRNLPVSGGRVTGIVDVDDICYGDPLYTTALADAAFLKEGWDTVYVDRWLTHYPMTQSVQLRFAACRLFWLVSFMRSAGQARGNGNTEPDRRERLVELIDREISDLQAMLR